MHDPLRPIPQRFRRLSILLPALLAILALLAAACGGDDDDGDAQATPAPVQAGADDDSDTSGDGDSGDDSTTDEPAATSEETTGEPVYGGTLIFGLEAETTNGFNAITAQPAVSGHLVMRQLYDPLVIEGVNGEPLPFLLESFTSNDDFTQWTLTLRPGIFFHNGAPADSTALARHFEELQTGTLLGRVVDDWDLQPVEILDDLSVRLTLGKATASLPNWLTGPAGYLAAPAMYDLGADSGRNPIGTGPFMLKNWVPNEVTHVVRNPDYWRTDAEGRQLPYLDAIRFRPIPDSDARFLALETGDLHANSENNNRRTEEYDENFKTFREEGSFAQTSYVLMNADVPPFDNVEFRRALAQCTDTQTYNDLRWGGETPPTGPFSPGTPGYLADSGYPTFDQDTGRATLERLGISSVELGTTNDPANLLNSELLARMWGDCGLDVSIVQTDQSELITNAVFGAFSAFLWRNHNTFDIGVERVWWHSDFTSGLATNFGRIRDDRIDAALDAALTTLDPAERLQLAEDLNRAFGEGVYNLWLNHTVWVVATQDNVYGVDTLSLPEGGEHVKLLEGRAFLAEAWLDES